MASNIKWFKRAYRALASGEMDMWEAIKKKIPESRISMLEKTFGNIMSEASTPEASTPEASTPEPKVSTPEPKVSTPEPKVSKSKTKKPRTSLKSKRTTKVRHENNSK